MQAPLLPVNSADQQIDYQYRVEANDIYGQPVVQQGRIRASVDPAAAKRELLRAIHVTCMDLVVNLRLPNSLELKPF